MMKEAGNREQQDCEDVIRRAAQEARVRLSEEETVSFSCLMREWLSALEGMGTRPSLVQKPLQGAVSEAELRRDHAGTGFAREDLLRSAAVQDGTYVVVPCTLEDKHAQ